MSGVVATWLWCLVIPSTHHVKAAFSSERRLFAFIRPAAQSLATEIVLSFRGGEASKAAVEDEDESERESEDEGEPEEEPEVQVAVDEENVKLDASLAASALKKTVRAQVKVAETVTATAKKAVSSKLKKKRSLLKALHVPYLIRASLNPFTLWKMTVAYWASLVNLDYLKKVCQNHGSMYVCGCILKFLYFCYY